MSCSHCVALYRSFQRALEISLTNDSEYAQEYKRYRWLIYRAHADACGGGS